jgi:biotin synthase
VDDILLCKDLDVEMAGIAPFIPHGASPLAGSTPGTAHLTLRMIALARIVLRDVHIPATTSLETIAPGSRKKALQCGANVIMPNITPAKYRMNYEIHPNKAGSSDTPEQSVARARAVAAELGRPIATGYGHSLRSQ